MNRHGKNKEVSKFRTLWHVYNASASNLNYESRICMYVSSFWNRAHFIINSEEKSSNVFRVIKIINDKISVGWEERLGSETETTFSTPKTRPDKLKGNY